MQRKPEKRNPWLWVPSLYFAEGIPYVVVMTVSVIMYKRLGISNTEIALYTSWLYLPWVIKPLWSPLVDMLRTKRLWIVIMQLMIGAGLGGVALSIPGADYFKYTLAFFWLLAFSSATHDIAADGFYMLGLSKHDQAWFVGVRSTFYRLAMITGQGLLIILAGYVERTTGLPELQLQVTARPGAVNELVLRPDSPGPAAGDGDLRLLMTPARLDIDVRPQPGAQVDSLLAAAKHWNTSHGFYTAEQRGSGRSPGSARAPSWWQAHISRPLAAFLRSAFGARAGPAGSTEYAGNVGIVYLRLSGAPPPDAEITVNFGRSRGDKSINLVEGSRFVFTASNWQTPAMAVIQLDPKLKIQTDATFAARAGNIPLAWMLTIGTLAVLFGAFFLYHRSMLPYPAGDGATADHSTSLFAEFFRTFSVFFKKKNIGIILAFLLLYRFAEAQLVKLFSPFLLDAQETGGLALTTGQVGFVYGTIGIIALSLGGILGGFLAARDGLKHWLWPMVIAINLPNAVYLFLAYFLPQNFVVVNLCVAIEQFGYGFGFTAYMLYMIYTSEGDHKTAHFAVCTGFMALGMMLPGMFSGWLQDLIGYQHFFVWVMIATLPGFVITWFIPLDPEFGKKTEHA